MLDEQPPAGLIEIGGAWWPSWVLERAPEMVLREISASFDSQGCCWVCSHALGASPWRVVPEAASGPFGAWTVSGRLAHPTCSDQPGRPTRERLTASVHAAFGSFPGAGAVDLQPVVTVVPNIDGCRFGVDPGEERIQDWIRADLLRRGWHRLASAHSTGLIDVSPSEATVAVSGSRISLRVGEEEWGVDAPEDLALAVGDRGLLAVIGPTTALYPGPLYGYLRI